MLRNITRCVAVSILALVTSPTCTARQIVLVRGAQRPSEEKQIREVADLFGLALRSVSADSPITAASAIREISLKETIAVIIGEDALKRLNPAQITAALYRKRGAGVPVLMIGLDVSKSSAQLKAWSGGALRSCDVPPKDFRPDAVEIGKLPDVAEVLAGWQLPAVSTPVCDLHWENTSSVQPILTAHNATHSSAVLVRVILGGGDRFFTPRTTMYDSSWMGTPLGLPQAFSSLAQLMFFVHYAAGEFAWHLPEHYANFTIDDPWLTDPYGHLKYRDLLTEMQRHQFHTTIAFVPWNFRRSDRTLAAFIREHPESFSICIHGNNHDHREFDDYQRAPLARQIVEIKQAIARMEQFQVLTGIPYDRFMVFPHGVSPEATFAVLKTYNFLGTANSLNVPRDARIPVDPIFLLRPYTVRYAQFLSLFRYSAEVELRRVDVAIQSFLGNPLLFYGHQEMFARGSGAFNEVADFVNHLKPDTHWASLGDIARHMYLVRKRDNAVFDIRMLSNEMVLKNSSLTSELFDVELEEDASHRPFILTIDGRQSDSGNSTTFRVLVRPGQIREIRVIYQNDLNINTENAIGTTLHRSVLRYLSDFRDIYLSRYSWGRSMTDYYYRRSYDSMEQHLESKCWAALVLIVVLSAGIGYWRYRVQHLSDKRAGRN